MGKILLTIAVVFLISCSSHQEDKNFLEKKVQNTDHRILKGPLTVTDSLNLSTLEIYHPEVLRMNKTYLFVGNFSPIKITAINKENFHDYYSIDIPKGKGPKELMHLSNFDVWDSLLVLADENQRKMLIWKLPDAFVKSVIIQNHQVSPHRVQILSSGSYLVFSPAGSGSLFNVINEDGSMVSGFQKLDPNHNMFAYEGEIRVTEKNIYYAGFSEPLFKRYTVKGKLDYSVSTVDNYNTEGNYVTIQGGKNIVMRYAPGALFSTLDFDIYKNYWLVIPSSNGDPKFHYLDIYNKENGKYIASFDLNHPTAFIQADERFIYAISKDNGDYYLMVYKNDINKRLK